MSGELVVAADFMPVLAIEQAVDRRNAMVAFVKQIMIEGSDYGKIPGIDKPTLLKPGAEKLTTFFGLSPEFVLEESTEDWSGHGGTKEPLFYYRYKAKLTRNGHTIGEGVGSCNSWETKYRYRWVPASMIPDGIDTSKLLTRDSTRTELDFAIAKGETSGQYGKPAAYWQEWRDAIRQKKAVPTTRKSKAGKEMDAWLLPDVAYRIPNPDPAEIVNTVQKMAQKRALVAAVLIGVNASEFFTQDVEDMDFIEAKTTPTPVVEAEVRPQTEVKPHKPVTQDVWDTLTEDAQKRLREIADGVRAELEAKGGAAALKVLEEQGLDADHTVAIWSLFDSTERAAMKAKQTPDTTDAEAAIFNCADAPTLVEAFNKLPIAIRRPGTAMHKLFKAKMQSFQGNA